MGSLDDDDGVVPGILSTANATRIHPKTLNNMRQKRARNWTKLGPTLILNSEHGNKKERQRKDKIIGPVNVLGTTIMKFISINRETIMMRFLDLQQQINYITTI